MWEMVICLTVRNNCKRWILSPFLHFRMENFILSMRAVWIVYIIWFADNSLNSLVPPTESNIASRRMRYINRSLIPPAVKTMLRFWARAFILASPLDSSQHATGVNLNAHNKYIFFVYCGRHSRGFMQV